MPLQDFKKLTIFVFEMIRFCVVKTKINNSASKTKNDY